MFKLICEIYSVLSSAISFPTSLCGVLVFDSVSRSRSRPRPLRSPLWHTIFHSHNFVTHHLSHTTSTNFVTHHLSLTQLCHTPSLSHTICHTQLAQTLLHTIFHTTLSQLSNTIFHTPSFTHNFVTHNFVTHHLSLTQLCHTPSLRGTWRHPLSLWGTGLALVARLGALGPPGRRATLRGRCGTWWHWPSLCVASVALGDIHLRFAWQAWRLAASTFVLRCRRGTWWHPPSFRVAGVSLGALGWLWWRAWARWEPLLGNLFVGTLPGNLLKTLLTCSWEPCLGTLPLPGNLAWESCLGTLLGNLFLGTLVGKLLLGIFAWEPVPGNVAWEPVPGNLAWEPLPGNLAWEPLGNLACLPGNLLGNLGQCGFGLLRPAPGPFHYGWKPQAYGLRCWGKTFHLVEETQSTLKTFFFVPQFYFLYSIVFKKVQNLIPSHYRF